MRSTITAILGALFAAPALADAPPPAWEGVWRGTVGTLPVMACLNNNGGEFSRGSYYYLSRMQPIALNHEKDGSWSENGTGGDKVTGNWTLTPRAGGGLAGEWRSGARVLPVTLARVDAGNMDDGPCGSEAYLAPRISPVRQVTKPVTKGGFSYSEITYNVGPHFEGVTISSFSFPATQPGDRAINAALRLDPAKPADPGNFTGCMQGALGSSGTDGDFAFSYAPGTVTRNFLSVVVDEGGDCGGAHPDEGQWQIVFDRQTGRKVDMVSWFTSAAVVPPAKGDIGVELEIGTALRRLLLRHYRFEDAECREPVASEGYWSIGIGRGGLAFRPSLPHVAEACEADAVVPFAALTPFLSPAGKQAVARLAVR